MNSKIDFIIRLATEADKICAQQICGEMEASAKARGTGIAKRTSEYLIQKMQEGKAVIAFTSAGKWAGFCYIETWDHGKYVANSGLLVNPDYRNSGLAKKIKEKILDLSREKYPVAKIFGLTTGLAVMKINSELGYKPVTYSELTNDDEFWSGCRSCVNYPILLNKERKNCLCTAMLYNPASETKVNIRNENSEDFKDRPKIYKRFIQIKQQLILNTGSKKEEKKIKTFTGWLAFLFG